MASDGLGWPWMASDGLGWLLSIARAAGRPLPRRRMPPPRLPPRFIPPPRPLPHSNEGQSVPIEGQFVPIEEQSVPIRRLDAPIPTSRSMLPCACARPCGCREARADAEAHAYSLEEQLGEREQTIHLQRDEMQREIAALRSSTQSAAAPGIDDGEKRALQSQVRDQQLRPEANGWPRCIAVGAPPDGRRL